MPGHSQNGQKQKIKRFVAPTMSRALALVKEELGPEAVILSSQRGAEGVEIITSLEMDPPAKDVHLRREFGQNFDSDVDTALNSDSAWKEQAGIDQAAARYADKVESLSAAQSKGAQSSENLAKEIERARERMLEAKRHAKEEELPIGEWLNKKGEAPADKRSPNKDSTHSALESESTALTDLAISPFGEVKKRPSTAKARHASLVQSLQDDENEKLESLQSELADMRMLLEQQIMRYSSGSTEQPARTQPEPNRTLISNHLQRMGLQDFLIQRIESSIKRHSRISDQWSEAKAFLSRMIPVSSSDLVDSGGVYAFVGQTGVGKTTTIAKLAARYVLQHGPGKVALVTTDSHRVGAWDQLKSVAKILNVPVKTVDADNSLITALASLKHFSLVLVDTAGFRIGDSQLNEQLAQLDACPAVKRVLVMACNSQIQTMKASIHAYRSAGRDLDACVLTKLDEATSLGEALSTVIQNELQVSYFTDGQDIPKDIANATGHSLVAKAVALLKLNVGDTSYVANY